jgi:hypothetical protein
VAIVLNSKFALAQSLIVAALLVVLAFVGGERVTSLVKSESQAAVVVSCGSKVIRRPGRTRK